MQGLVISVDNSGSANRRLLDLMDESKSIYCKDRLLSGCRAATIDDYIKFSVAQIDMFLSAVRANASAERWTTDPKVPRRLLTVTNINSFLITMRFLIQAGRSLQFAKVRAALDGFDKFDTKPFSSSQYNRMAEQIAKKYFGI